MMFDVARKFFWYRHPSAQKYISPYTTAGYIDPVMVVQLGGRSSGRGGWTTGLQLQGTISLCGFQMVADLYVEFGPREIQYAIP